MGGRILGKVAADLTKLINKDKCRKYCKKKCKRIGMKLVRCIFLDGFVRLNYC